MIKSLSMDAMTKAVEALKNYGATCALKTERVAARFECSIEDAPDALQNMGENARALAEAAGLTWDEASVIINDAECAQLRICNPWK